MEKLLEDLLSNLNPEQVIACTCMQNYLLTACPGSGKTRTIIYRLAYLSIIFPNSRLRNIAITYTNRAANEISERVEDLGINSDALWTGTIHQFCLEYIIRPYIMFSNRLKKGYRIIDEYIQERYVFEVCESLEIKIGYMGVRELLELAEVRSNYEKILNDKKEIDFDDILSISFELLNSYSFISTNISRQIRTIQVDEYQDTPTLQYKILKRIFSSNPDIVLSFVGDVNQSIYTDLGGCSYNKDELNEIYGVEFLDLKLRNCYRSTQKIINYYSNYQISKEEIVSMLCKTSLVSKVEYNSLINVSDLSANIAQIIIEELNDGVSADDICVLIPNKYLLYELGSSLRELLPELQFDSPELTPIKYDPMNPFYLIARLLFTEPGKKIKLRKRIANDMINILTTDFNLTLPKNTKTSDILKIINSTKKENNGLEMIENCINNIFEFFSISDTDLQICVSRRNFFKRIEERISKHGLASSSVHFAKCFQEKRGIVISTYHGVKGEEYNTVIGVGLLKGLIPHWKDVINKGDNGVKVAKLLIYVGCSRAKRNLYLFSERGRFVKSSGNALVPTTVLINP